MIDTIAFRCDDYKIMDGSRLVIEPESISAKTGAIVKGYTLWNNEKGNPMNGIKAYYNNADFNVTIKPLYNGGRPNCFVQLSLPKYLNGSNFGPLNLNQSCEAVNKLTIDLSGIGVELSIADAELSRADLFRNALPDEPFCSYISLLAQLKGKRQQKREFGTTYFWGNKQWSFNLYDKRAEMIGRRCANLPEQANVIRAECQLKRGKLKSVGLCKVSDLWQRYADLPVIYAKLLKDTIFNVPFIDSDVIAASQLEAEMLTYSRRGNRNWLTEYFQAVGIAHLCAVTGSETVLQTLDAIIEREGQRKDEAKQKYLSRWKRDITNKSFEIGALRTASSSSRTLGALYRELEAKLTVWE